MPSDQPSASTPCADAAPAPLSRLESTEDAKLALAPATCGSDASVAVDGVRQRLGLARVAVDVGHGAAQSLWSNADEVALLAAAAAFSKAHRPRPALPGCGGAAVWLRQGLRLAAHRRGQGVRQAVPPREQVPARCAGGVPPARSRMTARCMTCPPKCEASPTADVVFPPEDNPVVQGSPVMSDA
ncbi:hypothetical protein PAHAL_1G412200 [Panicum hallii]|uniref:Uncharacterized protein n=1 Tax=Panicum hallii TaxID=206008 RepID=A0A2T8KXX7_9POAL|nr:hypothetical protein PAHAL_1G412200 [Panicum hallii]